MLIEMYIEALLADEEVADLVWEAWVAGEIDDRTATLAWWLVLAVQPGTAGSQSMSDSDPLYQAGQREGLLHFALAVGSVGNCLATELEKFFREQHMHKKLRKGRWQGQPYKGSGQDIRIYAPRFLSDRLRGFYKDIRICLTPRESEDRPGNTHAYFPGLLLCCGTLEFLANLYGGSTDMGNRGELARQRRENYRRKFMSPLCYSADNVTWLYKALRNPTAHHGIAGGVFANPQRKITWKIYADYHHPAIFLEKLPNGETVRNDSPWDCPCTHRFHVRLGRLSNDIISSVVDSGGYLDALRNSKAIRGEFKRCMAEIYRKQR